MIKITARNFKLTEELKGHISQRLEKLNKYVKGNEKIEVVMETKTYGSKIEVTFKYDNKTLKASNVDNDLYVAIDLVVNKINKQIRRASDKKSDFSNISVKHLDFSNSIEEEKKPLIVKRKIVSLKPMFEEEAIEQMELLDHRSFIFFNASADAICMLYKRHDGDYGIIEIE